MSAAATVEASVGRKKKGEAPASPKPSPMITVKIKRAIHTKLAIVASAEGRDLSDLLSEITEAVIEKRYRQALAKLNEAE